VGKAPELIGKVNTTIQALFNNCYITGNFATNLAESWMHIHSKLDGGKKINRIQSGFWQGRLAGAGFRCNMGPSCGPGIRS